MKPTVYIETTIIGHLTSRLPRDPIVRAQMLETRAWWAGSGHAFELHVSDLVIREISRGDPQAAKERLESVKGIARLAVSNEAVEIALDLLGHGTMPAKAQVDAYHLGVAATNGMDFLLTWNCRHLANATLRRRIETVCRDHGFEPPIICTPSELVEVQ
jgi:hypothetical protein